MDNFFDLLEPFLYYKVYLGVVLIIIFFSFWIFQKWYKMLENTFEKQLNREVKRYDKLKSEYNELNKKYFNLINKTRR